MSLVDPIIDAPIAEQASLLGNINFQKSRRKLSGFINGFQGSGIARRAIPIRAATNRPPLLALQWKQFLALNSQKIEEECTMCPIEARIDQAKTLATMPSDGLLRWICGTSRKPVLFGTAQDHDEPDVNQSWWEFNLNLLMDLASRK